MKGRVVAALLVVELSTAAHAGETSRRMAALYPADRFGEISYSGQPADGDRITANGVVFEFDNNSSTGGGSTPVAIGANADATFGALLAALTALPDVVGRQDTGANTLEITGAGLVSIAETGDAGSVITVSQVDPCDGPVWVSREGQRYATVDCALNAGVGERFIANVTFLAGAANAWKDQLKVETPSNQTGTNDQICFRRIYCAGYTDGALMTAFVSAAASAVNLPQVSNAGANKRQWTGWGAAAAVWNHGTGATCSGAPSDCERADVQCVYERYACANDNLNAVVRVFEAQQQQNP